MCVEAIGSLKPEALERATITLERAFASDPLVTWIFPDSPRRLQALRSLYRVQLRYGLRYGRVTQANDAKAVAIWLPPGREISHWGMIRCGILDLLFRTGLGPLARLGAAQAVLARLHQKHMPEPHWYLLVVGVDPELAGRGLGSALVKEGLVLADQDSRPCYLETSLERNLSLYQRLGFTVLDIASLGKGGPAAWAMRREPQPSR
jgi:ribosomal protein S18 acetylase RimI-like enzyme